MTVIYCHEAKLRVANMGAEVLSGFIESVPLNTRQKFFTQLPTVTGFRKGSPLEFKERSKKLLHTLTHTNESRFRADGPEWVVLGNVWAYWATAHFDKGFALPEPPPAAHSKEDTFKFFKSIVESYGDEGCAKEDVDKLFCFSGFPESEEVSTLIKTLPTRDVIEQRRKYAQLPNEVEHIRNHLERLDAEIKSSKLEVQNISSDVKSQIKNITRPNDELNDFAIEIKAVQESLEAYTSQFRNELENLFSEIKSTTDTSSTQANLITKLTKSVSDLGLEHLELKKLVTDTKDELREIQKQVELTFNNLNKSFEPNGGLQSELTTSPTIYPQIAQFKIENSKLTNPKDSKSALAHIESNLIAMGIPSAEAEEVARVVITAALSGQILQINGSFAETLAQAVCNSLGAGNYLEWNVPLGLCDGRETAEVLRRMSMATDKPYCLHIRGINKSAFEIYGDDIRRMVAACLLELGTESNCYPIVATWAEGPATLPGGTPLLGLGPLIDSDKLSWSRAKPDKLKHGFLDTKSLIESIKDEVDVEELSDLVKDVERIAIPINQLRRRLLSRTTLFLLGLPKSDSTEAFQLIVAYWILPWAKVHGIGREILSLQIQKLSPGVQDTSSVAKGLSELSEESVN